MNSALSIDTVLVSDALVGQAGVDSTSTELLNPPVADPSSLAPASAHDGPPPPPTNDRSTDAFAPVQASSVSPTQDATNDPAAANPTDEQPLAVVAAPVSTTLSADLQQHSTERLFEFLSPAQESVMQQLLQGRSISETSTRTGIARSSIYRWRDHDAVFQTLYTRLALELNQTTHHRMRQMTTIAADVIFHALDCGDRKIAFELLKTTGMLKPQE